MQNRKTKPENPGLGGRLSLSFGFEKSLGYRKIEMHVLP